MEEEKNKIYLDLRFQPLTPEKIATLIEAIQVNAIFSLDLEGCKISEQTRADIAKALETNTSLTALNLSNTQTSEKSAPVLANLLKNNTHLTALYLRNNWLGNTGAQAIAEALKTNAHLATLDISHNGMNNIGATYIAQALHENACLTLLDLSQNQIGDTGAKAFIEALEKNTCLTKLDLEENDEISEEIYAELQTQLTQNKNRFGAALYNIAKKIFETGKNPAYTGLAEPWLAEEIHAFAGLPRPRIEITKRLMDTFHKEEEEKQGESMTQAPVSPKK